MDNNNNNNENNDNGKKECKRTNVWSLIYPVISIVGEIMLVCFLFVLYGFGMAFCFSCFL